MHGVCRCPIEPVCYTLDCKLTRLNDNNFILFSFLAIDRTLNTIIGDKLGVLFISMNGFMFFNEVCLHSWLELTFNKKIFAILYHMKSEVWFGKLRIL